MPLRLLPQPWRIAAVPPSWRRRRRSCVCLVPPWSAAPGCAAAPPLRGSRRRQSPHPPAAGCSHWLRTAHCWLLGHGRWPQTRLLSATARGGGQGGGGTSSLGAAAATGAGRHRQQLVSPGEGRRSLLETPLTRRGQRQTPAGPPGRCAAGACLAAGPACARHCPPCAPRVRICWAAARGALEHQRRGSPGRPCFQCPQRARRLGFGVQFQLGAPRLHLRVRSASVAISSKVVSICGTHRSQRVHCADLGSCAAISATRPP
jgi:hypothetical protein